MVTWPAKLLLFGEYTVLLKGEALAIPLPGMTGHWAKSGQVDLSLLDWAKWLVRQDRNGQLPWPIRTDEFLRFIVEGGQFISSIPQGCGVGSSGALVAACAETYSDQLPADIAIRLRGLAMLEKYFHGNSSGLDPLVSLSRQPIHRDSDMGLQAVRIDSFPKGLFLIETGINRQTAPLVEAFHLLLENESDRNLILMDLLPQVHRAIHALIHQDMIPFQDAFASISRLQRLLFKPMIPDVMNEIWQGPGHQLKLCGAGGGGFMLGFAPREQYPQLPFPIHPLEALLS